MNFEIALVVYDDHHEFRDMDFDHWTETGIAMLACGVVLEEDEKWLKLVCKDVFEYKDPSLAAKNLVSVILKSVITYERRFRIRDCPPVDGMLLAFRHMKQEEEQP